MRAREAGWKGQTSGRWIGLPGSWSFFIFLATTFYVFLGMSAFVAWRFTGRSAWIDFFLRYPGAVTAVGISAAGLVLSAEVARQFAPGDIVRPAWRLVSVSAACDLAGSLCTHLSPADAYFWRTAGVFLGSTLRFAVLALAFWFGVRVYRKSGFLVRLKLVDRFLLACYAGFIARSFLDIGLSVWAGASLRLGDVFGWPVDPLLWALALESLLLYRSSGEMGPGLVSLCWKAFSVGVFFTGLGDVLTWAYRYGYLHEPWNALAWFVWLPASTCFALAPAYQLQAMSQASGRRLRS